MTVEDLKSEIGRVDGWLTDVEGSTLYRLAQQCTGKGAIVEIGSWKGRSTIWLANGSRAGRSVRVYAVDPHTGSSEHRAGGAVVWTFDEFRRNIAEFQVDDLVTPIVRASLDAARDFQEPIELLFIDGDHEYDAVRRDFEAWVPKLIDGGMVVLHDSNAGGVPILDNYLVEWLGPRRVAEQYIFKSGSFQRVRLADTLTIAEKVQSAPFMQRLRSLSILAARLPYNAFFRAIPYWYQKLTRQGFAR